jgi:hypothetical protein
MIILIKKSRDPRDPEKFGPAAARGGLSLIRPSEALAPPVPSLSIIKRRCHNDTFKISSTSKFNNILIYNLKNS